MNFPSYKRGNRNLRKVNWLAQSRRTARHGRDMVGALNLPACLQLFPFLPLAAPSSLIPCCATMGNDFLSLRFFMFMRGTQLPLENSVRANNV